MRVASAEEAPSLITAQIHFIDERVSLVHIPLRHYAAFVQPLLQLLYPESEYCSNPQHHGATWASQHAFLNISFTPTECSVVCTKALATRYLAPAIAALPPAAAADDAHPGIARDDFIVISVEGEGLEAGQRVLELTGPLALAGISIFFITTYFSDYILVPARARAAVVAALSSRGFVFTNLAPSHNMSGHHRASSSTSSSSASAARPATPPPTTLSELEARTFALLARHGIRPQVDPSIRLLHTCASAAAAPAAQALALQVGLARCLAHPPRFLSLTLTASENPSLLLERHSLARFGPDVLLGDRDRVLVPIWLDLRALPVEASGIICGLAGRLASRQASASSSTVPGVEMSYLSTARAGAVMVDEAALAGALHALGGSLDM